MKLLICLFIFIYLCIVPMYIIVVMQLYKLHLKISLLLFKHWCRPINYDPLVEDISPIKSVHGFSCMSFHNKQVHNSKKKGVHKGIYIHEHANKYSNTYRYIYTGISHTHTDDKKDCEDAKKDPFSQIFFFSSNCLFFAFFLKRHCNIH